MAQRRFLMRAMLERSCSRVCLFRSQDDTLVTTLKERPIEIIRGCFFLLLSGTDFCIQLATQIAAKNIERFSWKIINNFWSQFHKLFIIFFCFMIQGMPISYIHTIFSTDFSILMIFICHSVSCCLCFLKSVNLSPSWLILIFSRFALFRTYYFSSFAAILAFIFCIIIIIIMLNINYEPKWV